MIKRSFRSAACGAVVLGFLLAGQAMAQNATIYQAVIGEKDQKTPEVSTEQMRSIMIDGSALVLDTRPRDEFVGGHIPGARNLTGPPAEAAPEVAGMVGGDKSRPLVLYCNGPFCQASRRMSDQLLAAGFTDVRRYQLGMPVWRALGGPTAIELEGVARIFKADQTAVFFDARSAEEFTKGSIVRARNLPPDKAATVQGPPMPVDDFNTRIVLFGQNAAQARALADALSKRPWHNVSYFPGSYSELAAALN